MKIGELSARAGVHLETIRYYERIGLLPPPGRTGSGHRRYGPQEAQRLRFIRRARDLGFAIPTIRNLVALSDGEADACGAVRDLTRSHLELVDEKIADLERLRRELRSALDGCEDGGGSQCPVIEALGAG